MSDAAPQVGFWRTVRLLLRAARRRAAARRRRQRELLQGQQRSAALGGLALFGAVLLAMAAHGMFCWMLDNVLVIGEYEDSERDGKLVVGPLFLREALAPGDARDRAVQYEVLRRVRAFGGEPGDYEPLLRRQLDAYGRDGFVVRGAGFDSEVGGLASIATAGPLALDAGMTVVVLWFLMMAFQGEGLELDVQRRRHPMWEWLFSHPIQPPAAFFAEMLTPLAANPVFATAPVFWGGALWWIYGRSGLLAGVLVGAAMAIAASCFSKAIEIAAMVRLSPRSRGAVLGIMSWVGYSLLMLSLFSGAQRGMLVALVWGVDRLSGVVPVGPQQWAFGVIRHGETSVVLAVVTCVAISIVVTAASVWLSARASEAGIAGSFADTAAPTARGASRMAFVRDPLVRKELLWLSRDRGAVVQAVLIPFTMGAAQAMNFRSLAKQAGESWNWFCGIGLLCGTYFLLVVGPRSLASEGGALWMALTWPRGLESLLKAKARLWWLIGTVVVFAVLALAVVRFPADAPQIALVAGGWIFFGRSLAEKTVTTVVAPSSSGEPEPAPKGRRWAVMLGTFSFAAGVISRNWHLAALGVVFSMLTSAAMWQNFRERLPCLFDPSSEKPPPPPTLMHAMLAITGMVDGMAIVGIPFVFMLGADAIFVTQTASYGVAALFTWIVMSAFLEARGVMPRRIWRWPADEQSPGPAFLDRIGRPQSWNAKLGAGAALGVVLGVVGVGYGWLLWRFPQVAEQLAPIMKYLAEHPQERWATVVIAVGLAPIAEEYLFRGLLFRALDREWGGWRAVIWSAVFFGVYHPPLSWLPVGLVGVVLALLFKASGSLWPCIVVHAVYNAIVTLTM